MIVMKRMPISWTIGLFIITGVYFFSGMKTPVLSVIFIFFYAGKYISVKSYNNKIEKFEQQLKMSKNLIHKVNLWKSIIKNESNTEFVKYAWQQIKPEILLAPLVPMSIDHPIVQNRICYYVCSVSILKQRISNGVKYYDFKNAEPAKLYIFDNTIEWIAGGHGSISITNIIEVKTIDYKIVSVIQKSGNRSINFYSDEACVIECLLHMVRLQNNTPLKTN